jgi:hypothetical protein
MYYMNHLKKHLSNNMSVWFITPGRFYMGMFFLLFTAVSKAQDSVEVKEYFFKDIGWHINIPAHYTMVDEAHQDETFERGRKAMLESNGFDSTTQIDRYEMLIAIHPDMLNYIDAQQKKFDVKNDGDWNDTQYRINEMTTTTLTSKLPNIKIDTLTSFEKIGGVLFRSFTTKLHINTMQGGVYTLKMYSALINGYDVGINICYLENAECAGKEFLKMFQNSRFTTSVKTPGKNSAKQ